MHTKIEKECNPINDINDKKTTKMKILLNYLPFENAAFQPLLAFPPCFSLVLERCSFLKSEIFFKN